MVKHEILLRGIYATAHNTQRLSPTILKIKDQNFVDRLFSDLSSSDRWEKLQAYITNDNNNDKYKYKDKDIDNDPGKSKILRLYQPVHRIFHVAILDASCSRPGEPRLDLERILQAGLVVRRLAKEKVIIEHPSSQPSLFGEGAAKKRSEKLEIAYEGWMKSEGRTLGWCSISSLSGSGSMYKTDKNILYDPDPKIRKAQRLGKNSSALERIETTNREEVSLEEDYTSLFVAPPEICKSAGKTILFGTISLTSMERAEGTNAITPAPFTKDDIRNRMPALLKAGGQERSGLPAVNLILTRESKNDSGATEFFETLKYLAQETGLFTDAPGTEQLKKVLDSIPLTTWPQMKPYLQPAQTLGVFLRLAYEVLFGQPEASEEAAKNLPTSILLPLSWPVIPATSKDTISMFTEQDIVDGIYKAMEARWNKLMPGKGRFDATDARYAICAFVRVKGSGDCPPQTIWSEPSEPFEIIPWYESSDIPPVQVELPDIDKNMLKKLMPNVAFKVPPSIQKFMGKINLDGLIKGEHPEEGGIEFGMICGFNIPTITICAFFVLNIFFSLLFNIVFSFWLPFIRICIPYPKKK